MKRTDVILEDGVLQRRLCAFRCKLIRKEGLLDHLFVSRPAQFISVHPRPRPVSIPLQMTLGASGLITPAYRAPRRIQGEARQVEEGLKAKHVSQVRFLEGGPSFL